VIPNFVGMAVASARTLAAARGISLDTSQSVPGNPPDTVASQSIAQGTTVDRNAIVRVVVNSGLPNAPSESTGNGPVANLPSVVGQDYDSARQMLTQAGYQIAVRYVQQSANNGTIVEQTPPAGQVPQGSTVIVMLSVSGEVPDTDGLTVDAATKLLRSYGYSVSGFEYTTSVGADGKVVGTQPNAGTPLAPESPVKVTVNGTPPP
jgi:serine/threonine-protein kinase